MTKTKKLYKPYKSKTLDGRDVYLVQVPSVLSKVWGIKDNNTIWEFNDKNEAIDFAKRQEPSPR